MAGVSSVFRIKRYCLICLFLPAVQINVSYGSVTPTGVKRPLKIRQNKDLNDKWFLNEVESITECFHRH